MIDTTTNLEITILEDLLNDECKCESSHQTGAGNCSQKVTSISTHLCQPPKLICFNATVGNVQHMKLGRPCAGCGRLASECWSIRPV